MNGHNHSLELSTEETEHSKSIDIENKPLCPFSGSRLEMPKGHEKYSESDKEKCPVMSGLINVPGHNAEISENPDETKPKKKEKKPKGGCPFMSSDNKKAPALELYTAGYEETYNSAMSYLINYKPSPKKIGATADSKRWENIPIFLKHTLFHDEEEKMDNIRKLEIAQRFFIYDKFREQANKNFNKGRYEEAIGLYEHALSCFKWLKYKDIKQKKKSKKAIKDETVSNDSTISEIKEDASHLEEDKEMKINEEIGLNKSDKNSDDDEASEEAGEEEDEHLDPYKDLKPLNKALLKPITDENIEIHDGEDVEDEGDRDMRNSMVSSAYHGLAVCYLKLHHYSLALQAIEEALKVNEHSSQLHFRRAQARAFNKGSNLEDLLKAKQDIEKAIELKKTEKIFKNEAGILKMLNIHNADEVYQQQAQYIEAIIKEKTQEINENVKEIMTKVREIEFLGEAFRKEGKKVPFETPESMNALEIDNNYDDQMEWDVTNEMIKKYYKLIEFYQGTERKDQVEIAKKEIQTVLEIREKMRFYRELDFNNWEQNEIIKENLKDIKIDMTSKRVQDRLRRFKNERSKEAFEDGDFNVEVYHYALKDYLKKKEEKEQKLKKGKTGHDEIEPKKNRLTSLFGFDFNLQIVGLVVVFLALWYLNKNNLIPTGFLWSDSQNKGSFA